MSSEDPRIVTRKGIDFTPDKPSLSQRYKYYCPICMMYFENMYKTQCCGHSICSFCIRDMKDRAQQKRSRGIECPFCTIFPCSWQKVTSQEDARCYRDEITGTDPGEFQPSDCFSASGPVSGSPIADTATHSSTFISPVSASISPKTRSPLGFGPKTMRRTLSEPDLTCDEHRRAAVISVRELFLSTAPAVKQTSRRGKERRSSTPAIVQKSLFRSNKVYPNLVTFNIEEIQDEPKPSAKSCCVVS